MYAEIAKDFVTSMNLTHYTRSKILLFIKQNTFTIYANQWIEEMYETILSEYEILDEFNTKDMYSQDVFEDPEFYGINFEVYEQLIIDRELEENPDAYDIDNIYSGLSEETMEKYREMTKQDLFKSGKLQNPEFVEIARREGLGEIVDELLEEMEKKQKVEEKEKQKRESDL